MANQLKMAERQSILTLARLGWSYRRIAAELGLDRDTVSRHVKAAGRGDTDLDPAGPRPPDPNAAIVITGSAGSAGGATSMAEVPGLQRSHYARHLPRRGRVQAREPRRNQNTSCASGCFSCAKVKCRL